MEQNTQVDYWLNHYTEIGLDPQGQEIQDSVNHRVYLWFMAIKNTNQAQKLVEYVKPLEGNE